MTDAEEAVLDTLERETLALLERASFSIRDDARDAERRLNLIIDPVTDGKPSGEAGIPRDAARPSRD